ncbi:hypothetical protein MPS_0623 [Mycobacterium pseudoshottsii JCM 15466]|nr:hypothetical protein MPS_0623 [Mycobacterium pseudoshottsii JCM 15466]
MTGQARDDGGLEHFATGSRIAANHGYSPARSGRTGQVLRGSGAKGQGQLGGQFAIRDPAHSVGAE